MMLRHALDDPPAVLAACEVGIAAADRRAGATAATAAAARDRRARAADLADRAVV